MDSYLYILLDVTTQNKESIPAFNIDNIGNFKDLTKIDNKLKILYESYHDARTMWQSSGVLETVFTNMSDDDFDKLMKQLTSIASVMEIDM